MKTLVRRLLRHFDLDLVRTHTTPEGHLARLLAALRVNVALDVGAHRGEYAQLLREIGYRGRIVSFEPVELSYANLWSVMAGDPGWRGYQMALGSTRGKFPIHVMAATDQTSFLTPSKQAADWFGGATTVMRTELVTVARLDDVIGDCVAGIPEPRVYLKMDTQGYDAEVLTGADAALGYVVGMQTEIAAQPLYDGVPLFPDNVRPFLAHGFEPTGLFAVSREPDRVAAIEYDLMLRRA